MVNVSGRHLAILQARYLGVFKSNYYSLYASLFLMCLGFKLYIRSKIMTCNRLLKTGLLFWSWFLTISNIIVEPDSIRNQV